MAKAVRILMATGVMLALALPASSAAAGLHVSGSRLLDSRGRALVLRGVNRSGSEYACIQGFGIFDGPSDAASVKAIASWHVNFTRVLLNEDCWLGINGVKPTYSGTAYRHAILSYVSLLHHYGIYVEVSLIWAAPGHHRATYQPSSPDEDHAPTMWASMAAAFKHDRGVVLAPWGETLVTARCFLHGGNCGSIYRPTGSPYRTAGMQQAVNVMRGAGFRGPISIPGVQYADDLSHWLKYEPHDPLHQLVAEAHVYGKNACSEPACLNQDMAPVAKKVPLILGEYGETFDASSCGSTNTSTILHWADAHHVGYAAWTWDTWGTCLALINNYNGTAANQYGSFVQSYYGQHKSTTDRLGS